MKHGESNVEWQISIQGIHTSAFCNYFWKREGNFNEILIQTNPSKFQFMLMDQKYIHKIILHLEGISLEPQES